MILYFTSPLTVGIDPSEETADLMLKRRTRLTAICVVTVAGIASGLLGAAAFNLAGLTFHDGELTRALFWEPGESDYIVVAGCVFLLGWLVSLGIVLALCVHTPHAGTGRAVTVVSVVSLVTSVVAVGAALVILVAILPMDYPWSAV